MRWEKFLRIEVIRRIIKIAMIFIFDTPRENVSVEWRIFLAFSAPLTKKKLLETVLMSWRVVQNI